MIYSKLFPLAKIATAEEARNKAGHSLDEWDKFYIITKEEARKITDQDMAMTWPRVPPDVKRGVVERVNACLREREIPEVGEDVMAWRMSRAIRDTRHNLTNILARHRTGRDDRMSGTGG